MFSSCQITISYLRWVPLFLRHVDSMTRTPERISLGPCRSGSGSQLWWCHDRMGHTQQPCRIGLRGWAGRETKYGRNTGLQWLVGGFNRTPLTIWLSQAGWWNSQQVKKYKMLQTTNQMDNRDKIFIILNLEVTSCDSHTQSWMIWRIWDNPDICLIS